MSKKQESFDGDAMDWTPAMALESARRDCDHTDPDACIVIFLKRQGGVYDTTFVQSGLAMSEAVALLEIQKTRMIRRYMDADNREEGAGV